MVSLGWKIGGIGTGIGLGALGIAALSKKGKEFFDNINPFKKLSNAGANIKSGLQKVSDKMKANVNKIRARREERKAEIKKKLSQTKQKVSNVMKVAQAKVKARHEERKAQIKKVLSKPLPKISKVIKNAKKMKVKKRDPFVTKKPASKLRVTLPRRMIAVR